MSDELLKDAALMLRRLMDDEANVTVAEIKHLIGRLEGHACRCPGLPVGGLVDSEGCVQWNNGAEPEDVGNKH